jgi:Flp pilus assembly protein TadG
MQVPGLPFLLKRQNGQLLPAIAVVVLVLLGIAALGTDMFLMYWSQQNLQRASDAAALAGATYLSDTTFSGANAACTYATSAQQAACTYALANGVLSSEIQSITVAADGKSITVVTSRQVPATFARLLGFTQFTVNAQAVAGIQVTGQTYNVIPIGLDSTTPYTYGQAIVMHNGNCGPGCWGAVDYAGSSGANSLGTQLTNGCGCTVTAGSTYQVGSFSGAKTGPVDNGISQRISNGLAADSSGTWQSHSFNDVRVATVGLVTWGSGTRSTQTATVQGFAEVWLTGSSNANINVIFISQVVPGASGSGTVNAGAMRTVLLQ